jgi:hypothetical protein
MSLKRKTQKIYSIQQLLDNLSPHLISINIDHTKDFTPSLVIVFPYMWKILQNPQINVTLNDQNEEFKVYKFAAIHSRITVDVISEFVTVIIDYNNKEQENLKKINDAIAKKQEKYLKEIEALKTKYSAELGIDANTIELNTNIIVDIPQSVNSNVNTNNGTREIEYQSNKPVVYNDIPNEYNNISNDPNINNRDIYNNSNINGNQFKQKYKKEIDLNRLTQEQRELYERYPHLLDELNDSMNEEYEAFDHSDIREGGDDITIMDTVELKIDMDRILGTK